MGFFTISNKGLQAKTYNRNINSLSKGNIIDMSRMISYTTFLATIPNANVLEDPKQSTSTTGCFKGLSFGFKDNSKDSYKRFHSQD